MRRRRLALALSALLLPASALAAEEGDAAARFLARVEAAFEAEDASQLVALVCWDRVTDDMRRTVTHQLTTIVAHEVASLALEEVEETPVPTTGQDGVLRAPNLEVVKKLRIEFVPDVTQQIAAMGLPLGEKGGELMIAPNAPVPFPAAVPATP